MGKKLFFQRKSGHHQCQKKMKELQLGGKSAKVGNSSTSWNKKINPVDVASSSSNGKSSSMGSMGKKKLAGARLWMRLDRFGHSELLELDKSAIIKRVSIPARDMRIFSRVFSQSSNILVRDKATILNLDFIKAIVTAEEVLLPDPLSQEVIPFVDQLKLQTPTGLYSRATDGVAEGLQHELPFELQVLEIALEVVCTRMDNSMEQLELDAYSILDELTRNITTENLNYVRTLKSDLTSLLARVQKVRNEIEHVLDDDEHLANLYLTKKQKQHEALLGATDSNNIATLGRNVSQISSNMTTSLITGNRLGEHDVEDLEMLLEAYFMQLDGTRNHLLTIQKLREYIEDTEDFVGTKLNNQRNDLIQIQMVFNMAAITHSVDFLICAVFSVNIPCPFIFTSYALFVPFTVIMLVIGFLVFVGLVYYARRKGLLSFF